MRSFFGIVGSRAELFGNPWLLCQTFLEKSGKFGKSGFGRIRNRYTKAGAVAPTPPRAMNTAAPGGAPPRRISENDRTLTSPTILPQYGDPWKFSVLAWIVDYLSSDMPDTMHLYVAGSNNIAFHHPWVVRNRFMFFSPIRC